MPVSPSYPAAGPFPSASWTASVAGPRVLVGVRFYDANGDKRDGGDVTLEGAWRTAARTEGGDILADVFLDDPSSRVVAGGTSKRYDTNQNAAIIFTPTAATPPVGADTFRVFVNHE